ncbi:MAG: hypothetical protein EKK41_21205 [Hyphomicrobiales bacterium]|nr:MAG: hypothetical protein EKK41_21205 [Hyphomicrobiales bacterium]
MVAALLFTITAFISLGGMAGKADKVIAARQDTLDAKAETKKRIDELLEERAVLRFTRTTQEAVDASKRLADAATAARAAECGNGDARQRGNNCRAKETAEGNEIASYARAQRDKASTDRADAIDSELKALRAQRLGNGGSVGAADPLAAVLEKALGAWATVLTSTWKMVTAVGFDLALVMLAIGIERLGDHRAGKPMNERRADTSRPEKTQAIEAEPTEQVLPASLHPKLVASNEAPTGSVRAIITANLAAAKGARVEIAELGERYKVVCRAQGKRAVPPAEFVTAVAQFCTKLGLKLKDVDDQLYLMDVQLTEVRETA